MTRPSSESTRYQRLSALFTEAMKVPTPQRAAFVESACGSDLEMLRELRRLIELDSGHDRETSTGNWLADLAGIEEELLPAQPDPEQIGGFRILAKIGEGGMGAVYHAIREADYVQHVAIKMLKRGSDTAAFRARFRNEVRFLAELGQHPNIAGLLDASHLPDGTPYLVMEYVDGQRIDDYCDSKRLPIRDRLHMMLGVCAAVGHAHQHTVIHRDIKPSNILVTEDESPRLIDFGIAKLVNATPQPEQTTRTGFRIFTPEYASPEQIEGRPLTTASDVYSLGVVLYELLTGHHPRPATPPSAADPTRIERPSSAVRRRICIRSPDGTSTIDPESISRCRRLPPKQLYRQLVGDLDNIILKAVRVEPERRYLTVEQLAADIRCFLDGLPVSARRDNLKYRCGKFVRRHRVGVTAAGLAGLAIVLSLFGFARQWMRAEEAAAEARGATAIAEEQRSRAEAAADEAIRQRDTVVWHQYRTIMSAAAAATSDSSNAALMQQLERAPPQFRGWEWHHLQSQCDSSFLQLAAARLPITYESHALSKIAYGDDGKLLAFCGRNGIELWDTATWIKQAEFHGFRRGAQVLLFNPQGTRLVAAGQRASVRIWAIAEQRLLAEVHPPARDNASGAPFHKLWPVVAMGPQGQTIAAAFGDGVVHVVNLIDGRLNARHELPGVRIEALQFSAQEDQLAVGTQHSIHLVNTATGRIEVTLTESLEHGTRQIEFSPDGQRLAAAGDYPDNVIRLWNLKAIQQDAIPMFGHHNRVSGLAFNHDGTRLMSHAADGMLFLWHGRTGQRLSALRGHRETVNSAAFVAGGKLIVSGSMDSTIRVWDAESGTPGPILRGGEACVDQLAIRPDGTELAAADGMEGVVRIWQMASLSGVLAGHTKYVYGVDVSPDDRFIASAAWDGTIRIWNLESGHVERVLDGGVDRYLSVVYSPDGSSIAAGTNLGITHIWNVEREEKRELGIGSPRSLGARMPVAFSRDGNRLAAADGDGFIAVWDLESGVRQPVCRQDADHVHALVFDPSASELIIGLRESQVQVWRIETRQQTAIFGDPDGSPGEVRAIACSPSQPWLAFAGMSGEVQIWDRGSGELLARLLHPCYINALAFNPEQTRLAVGCQDGAIRMWDTRTWEQVVALEGHREYVHGLAFTHDGTRLVSGSGDTTVRVWDTVPMSRRYAERVRQPGLQQRE